MSIVCVGQSTLDYVWHAETLPHAEGKHQAHGFHTQGGGMAANAAVALARLGADVHLWSRVGDDAAGAEMRNKLQAAGVGIEHVEIDPSAQSSVSSIVIDAQGERQIVNFRGAGLRQPHARVPDGLLACADAVLADTRWPEAATCAFTAARVAGITTVLDADIAAPEIYGQLMPLADYAIFSAPGLRAAAPTANTVEDALQACFLPSHRLVAVTRGANSIVWFDGRNLHLQPVFNIPTARDTTGAGDAFHGAFTFAIAAGQTAASALTFASACAALKCQHIGARTGLPSATEVHSFLLQSAPKVLQ